MSTVGDCGCSCATPTTINTPGPAGDAGQNAFSTTTANFTIPAINANVTVLVDDSDWMGISQRVFASDGTDIGTFQVVSKAGSTSALLKFLGYTGDSAPGAIIGSGATVSPSGTYASPVPIANGGTGQITRLAAITALIDSADITDSTAITDNSTGTAGNTVAAGVGVSIIPIYVQLAQITATTIFNVTPGYRFKVLATSFSSEVAVTTAAKLATLTPAINGVGVTGGAVALTSANCTPKGTTVAGSAVTAGNVGTAAQTLTVVASAVTTFSEGTGWYLIRVQNLDTADAVASLISKTNQIMASLTS